jgi:hypothetical protein
VGHRALVGYERAGGRYAVHHTQWGADGLALRESLTPATPFGRPVADSPVEPTPRAVVDSVSALAAELDYLSYEAVYLVDRDWRVEAFLPLWVGFVVTDGDPTAGVLVAVPDADAAATLREWFRSLKTRLALLVERGRLPPSVGRRYLRARVRERAVVLGEG